MDSYSFDHSLAAYDTLIGILILVVSLTTLCRTREKPMPEHDQSLPLWFIEAMRSQLKVNEYKGGWQDDEPFALLTRVFDEARELRDLLNTTTCPSPEDVMREAADVANMAMMVADTFRINAATDSLPL
jgi:NTP pyrophosphatase (non-canonical NTP hydrolase)